jgi:hypothetical protein
MDVSKDQMAEIRDQVYDILNKGVVEPEKSLLIKAVFDKYRTGGECYPSTDKEEKDE